MKPAATLLLAATVSLLAAPALAQPAAPELSVSGYDRVRIMSQFNYDLDRAAVQDNWYPFTDIRSYLTLEGKFDSTRVVSSVDLAGSDFDQGALMGYDNPARQRLFDLKVRHLFVEQIFPFGLTATLGRQPARVGYGLVSGTNRDAFKLTQALPDLVGAKNNVMLNVVRGAKGNSVYANSGVVPPDATSEAGRSATIATNDPNGNPHELGTVLLAYNAAPVPGSKLQAFVAQQFDTTQNSVYPQKRYADLNGEWSWNGLTFGGEAVYLGGQGPAAAGARPTLNSFALLASGKYALGPWEFGLMAARGGGDNDAGDGQNANFQSLFIDEANSFTYNNLFSNDLWGYNGTDASIGRGVGLANVTFFKPSIGYAFIPDLKANLSYTKQLATAPQRAGSGILGTTATTNTALATNIGDEIDLGASYQWGRTNFYGIVSGFVPGDVFAKSGIDNAAYKLELGTEVRF